MGKITIASGGRLVFDPAIDPATSPLQLTANMIELTGGELWIGSEDCPYTGDAEVLLTGKRDESEGAPSVQKAVLVREGVLEIHGKPKVSWTSLAATVPKTSREEMTDGSIYSVIDGDNTLDDRGFLMFEFNSTGHFVSNWNRVTNPRVFDRLKDKTGNVIIIVTRERAIFGSRFSPQELAEGFEGLCYGPDGQGTSAIRDMVHQELKAFAAICHIGFPENSVEAAGTVANDRSQTGMLVKRIGEVDFVAMSVVSRIGFASAHRIEAISFPAGSVPSLERVFRTVDPVCTWQVGDRIVLASTDYHHDQAEEFEILECDDCSDHEIKVKGPVWYTHWGEVTAGVEMRAEVGLLTRNVRFSGKMEDACYGDNLCDTFDDDTFGAQIKILRDFSVARIENAEFYHMGQQPVIGSYPIHFHMCLDTSGKDVYIRSNSIHNTFSRCLTIHGTHNVTVENNIAYRHLGHCFFLEDGGEQHNKLIGNLGLGTMPGTLLPTDKKSKVSTFWISNPDNTMINNCAAGSDGIGIWVLMAKFPTGPSASVDMGLKPGQSVRTLIPAFHGNKVHSNLRFGFRLDDILLDDGKVTTASYKPLVDATNETSAPAFLQLDNLVAYKNFEGVWIKSFWSLCTNFRMAENVIAIIFASSGPADRGLHYEMLANSRIVGETDNKGEPAGTVTLSNGTAVEFDRSRPRINVRHAQLGVAFYRGPVHVRDTSFAGFKGNGVRDAGAISKKPSNPYFSSPIASVANVSFEFSDPAGGSRFWDGMDKEFKQRDGNRHNIVLDLDGSLTNTSGVSVVRPNPLLINERCVLMPTWGEGSALCPDRFTRLKVGGAGHIPTFMTRNDLMSSETETPLAERQISYSLNTLESYILHFNTTVPEDFSITPYGLEKDLYQVVGICVGVDQEITVKPKTYSPASRTEVMSDTSNSKYFYDSEIGVITFR